MALMEQGRQNGQGAGNNRDAPRQLYVGEPAWNHFHKDDHTLSNSNMTPWPFSIYYWYLDNLMLLSIYNHLCIFLRGWHSCDRHADGDVTSV